MGDESSLFCARLRGWSCLASWSASWRVRRRSWWGRCPPRRGRMRWAVGDSKCPRLGRATIPGATDHLTFDWTVLWKTSTTTIKGWRFQLRLTLMCRTGGSRPAAGGNNWKYLRQQLFQVRIFTSWWQTGEKCVEDGKLPTGWRRQAVVDLQAGDVRAELGHLQVDEGDEGGKATQRKSKQALPLWLHLRVLIVSYLCATRASENLFVIFPSKFWVMTKKRTNKTLGDTVYSGHGKPEQRVNYETQVSHCSLTEYE